ncbi:hypothetical protein B0H14DRAFT_3147428 [Mycena olivaceomarginata]|nr:hypothetical protein B0H14DRAFT_3147428 [Mycena olivaceomarginata]
MTYPEEGTVPSSKQKHPESQWSEDDPGCGAFCPSLFERQLREKIATHLPFESRQPDPNPEFDVRRSEHLLGFTRLVVNRLPGGDHPNTFDVDCLSTLDIIVQLVKRCIMREWKQPTYLRKLVTSPKFLRKLVTYGTFLSSTTTTLNPRNVPKCTPDLRYPHQHSTPSHFKCEHIRGAKGMYPAGHSIAGVLPPASPLPVPHSTNHPIVGRLMTIGLFSIPFHMNSSVLRLFSHPTSTYSAGVFNEHRPVLPSVPAESPEPPTIVNSSGIHSADS